MTCLHFGDLFSKNSDYLFTVRSFVEEMASNSVMDFMSVWKVQGTTNYV